MVWYETLNTYHEMISEEGWTTTNSVDVHIIQKLTFKVCVHVLLIMLRLMSPFPVGSADTCKMRLWSSF